jgi:predicted nucleic acid-binding protein
LDFSDILLACALAGQADFLITGDRDFEEIENFNGTKILSVSQFKAFVIDK